MKMFFSSLLTVENDAGPEKHKIEGNPVHNFNEFCGFSYELLSVITFFDRSNITSNADDKLVLIRIMTVKND